MDDLDGVLAGQMQQRFEQHGLNDAGWRIIRGNERFLHQIDPDRTSAGFWRVGGDVTPATPVYARFARGFDHAGGKDAMYFDIKDSFFAGKAPGKARALTVRVVYFDQGTGRWALAYDATGNPRKNALIVTKAGSGTWKEATARLDDACLDNRGPRGADLMLVNLDAEDDIFHMIEVTRAGR